ncbi:unnamed protein product [Merluccius merluccius]
MLVGTATGSGAPPPAAPPHGGTSCPSVSPTWGPGAPAGPLAPPDPVLLPGAMAVGSCSVSPWLRRLNLRQEKLSGGERRRREAEERARRRRGPDREVQGCRSWAEYRRLVERRSAEQSRRRNRRPAHLWEKDVTPLHDPREGIPTAELLEKISVVKPSRWADPACSVPVVGEWRISFDVHQPSVNTEFRKSSPGTPYSRVCVCSFDGPVPGLGALQHLSRESGGVPVTMAVVDHGDISFYTFKHFLLPRDLPHPLAAVCAGGGGGGAADDCSFVSLFRHLNLSQEADSLVHVRPVRNWTTNTVVKVNMVVYGIIEVNEKAQTFTCQTWHSINEFLSWDPANFCGITKLEVPRKMMWSPDILVQQDTSASSSTLHSRNYMLFSDGAVIAEAVRQLKATCQMNLYYFPKDVQRCNVTFLSFFYQETYMSTNGEWEMTAIAVFPLMMESPQYNYSTLTYQITLVRRPMLYIMNCILPLFYFLVLDVGTFFISEAHGEKLSLKVTLLLSISVLLLILQDILPSTSEKVPLIALYAIVIFSLMAVSLLEAMLVSFLMDMDRFIAERGPAPSRVATETQMETHLSEPSGGAEKTEMEEEHGENEKEGPPDHFLLELILEEVKSVRQEVSPGDRKSGDRKSGFYRRLAMKIDAAFFVCYVVTNTAFLVYLYYAWELF